MGELQSARDVVVFWSARIAEDIGLRDGLSMRLGIDAEGAGGGQWSILADRRFEMQEGICEGHCVIHCSAADLILLAGGKLNPQEAFLSRRLRLSGDYEKCLRLYRLFD